ncbi:MAG: hypothetical protein M1829_005833 [Trizodia sp. TS-e1964]|nr:MAG: hypothetical protein M1829_005833 [Trizodia sp. TS-e1964]
MRHGNNIDQFGFMNRASHVGSTITVEGKMQMTSLLLEAWGLPRNEVYVTHWPVPKPTTGSVIYTPAFWPKNLVVPQANAGKLWVGPIPNSIAKPRSGGRSGVTEYFQKDAVLIYLVVVEGSIMDSKKVHTLALMTQVYRLGENEWTAVGETHRYKANADFGAMNKKVVAWRKIGLGYDFEAVNAALERVPGSERPPYLSAAEIQSLRRKWVDSALDILRKEKQVRQINAGVI